MHYNTRKTAPQLRNHEDAPAWAMTQQMELYTAVVTTMLADGFYERADVRVARIADLVRQVPPRFVAQLAVYARTQMNLRSVPLLLAVELARVHSGDDLVARTIDRIVLRADEITELLACYQTRNGRQGETKPLASLSHQVQRGLQLAFNHFDAYQFAKYNRTGTSVTLRDALFLVHPRAKDADQQVVFDQIASQTLPHADTWEARLSAAGQIARGEADLQAAKAEAWAELIDSHRLGYMAALRNLRNLLTCGLDGEHLQAVCRFLANEQAVAHSRQLPFRFLAAYRELSDVASPNTAQVLDALEQAVKASAANIAGFGPDTSVVLASDVSSSMWQSVSPRSRVQYYDIGLMLSMLLHSRCRRVVAGMFGDTWKAVNLPHDSILANVEALRRREGEVGYSTNGHKVVEWLIQQHMAVDKVMLFTDCQLWNSDGNRCGDPALAQTWHSYRSQVAPHARLYLFDLAGYGQSPISLHDGGVACIAGWSDKVFDILDALEHGSDALKAVTSIEL